MKNIYIATLFAAILIGMPLVSVLAQDVGSQPPAMPQMSMGGMMENCQKHCDTMSGTMADMTKTIAAARKSNDVSKLHTALDHVQAGITKMEAQMKDCQGMMQHMGRGGMMNQPAPDAPHSH